VWFTGARFGKEFLTMFLIQDHIEKMSWADTAKAMAASGEDWSEWEGVSMDGLSDSFILNS